MHWYSITTCMKHDFLYSLRHKRIYFENVFLSAQWKSDGLNFDWFPMFFKIPASVFRRRKKVIQAFNDMKGSKWWQNIFGSTNILLEAEQHLLTIHTYVLVKWVLFCYFFFTTRPQPLNTSLWYFARICLIKHITGWWCSLCFLLEKLSIWQYFKNTYHAMLNHLQFSTIYGRIISS